MSATTAPTLNLIANGIRTSLSRVFSSKSPHPFLPLPSGSVKVLHLSSSFTPSTLLFLEPKRSASRGSPLISLVAQTSEVGFEWEGEQIESGADEDVEGGEDGDSYPVPSEEAKIFVGNLPYDVEGADLAELFNKAGVVETAEVIYNRDTDQSRGFGFVTMSTVEEADKAVEMFQRYDINGRLLTVNKAAPRGSRVDRSPREFEPAFRIYVGNLSWGVDDSRLEQVFSEHGKVVEARVVYDRESGRSRGFGFVKMSSQIELDDAIAALDGQNLDGRAIRVNVAEERPRRGSF